MIGLATEHLGAREIFIENRTGEEARESDERELHDVGAARIELSDRDENRVDQREGNRDDAE